MFLVGCIAYKDIVLRPAFDHRFSPDDFGYQFSYVPLITVTFPDHSLCIPPIVVVSNIYTVFQTQWDYNIELQIQRVDEPKLFIYSSEDEVAPYMGGLRVFQQAPEPKELWTVYGEHGKMVREDQEKYEEKLIGWMNSILHAD
jgi:hypothetical protein